MIPGKALSDNKHDADIAVSNMAHIQNKDL